LQHSSDNAEWQLREELIAEIVRWSNFAIAISTHVVTGASAVPAERSSPALTPRSQSKKTSGDQIQPQSPNDFMQYNSHMLTLAAAVVSAAAAVAAGYQSMSPTVQWYGRTFTGLARGSRLLALTYDDGPNDPHTLRLLDVLAKHNVHATFFLIGRYIRQQPQIARELVQAGHVVGNHTFTHPLLIFKSEAEIRQELTQCRDALQDAIGNPSDLFRPPFGGRRPATLSVARQLGLVPVMWNVTGYDWNAPPAAAIERKVAKQIRGGDVILLHDGGHKQMGADRSQTVIATDHLITRYKAEDYEFVTIPQMTKSTRP
jgi:peptidoglycan-N-acetylglucosamine deacetylase